MITPENLLVNDISIPYYKSSGKEIEIFEKAYQIKVPLLLKGPTGTGKSRFIEFMAHQLNKQLITVSCHEETSATDLIGRYIIKGTETVWIDGPLTNAVKLGAIIYLDEIAEARPDVLVAIHSLTDHRRQLFIDKLGITIKAHADFLLVASFNPGYQRGFKEIKPSTRQRFASIHFAYPKADVETEIVASETGVSKDIAKKLIQIGNKIRNLKELGLAETVSTLLLVNAAQLIHEGLPHRLSVRIAVIEPLSDDVETVEAMCDLADLLI